MGQKEYGNVGAGIPSDRPEVQNRHLEIKYFILTKEQTEYYLNVGREIELNKWKNQNPSFKASSAHLEDISKKD